jgi:predicted NUDIX family phosphoesterase
MESIQFSHSAPTDTELRALEKRAEQAGDLLRSSRSEAKLPLIFEFSGSPKSGKSTLIGILSHFFKRCGFRVGMPAEGASLRTPRDLKSDLLAFNAWSACYAIQSILEESHAGEPEELVFLDRGLFDAAVWMRFLETEQGRLTPQDRASIEAFLRLEFWRTRESAVFLFTADEHTSLIREADSKLTSRLGSAMEPQFLRSLLDQYLKAARDHDSAAVPLYHVDTSFVAGEKPNFQAVALELASRVIEHCERSSMSQLLVIHPIDQSGFITDSATVERTLARISGHPKFLNRDAAESDVTVQQVVPYGLLRNTKGEYLCARRRADGRRRELAGKSTFLFGGHAEQKDWDKDQPDQVFETCIRREIDEELIGLQVHSVRKLGLLHDDRSPMGQQHLAIIHEVDVGGIAGFRRQTVDKEFGREPARWKSREQLVAMIDDLDPWSQLVASKLFGVVLRPQQQPGTLFSPPST